MRKFILLGLMIATPALADPTPTPTDEQVELSALQNAELACGVAVSHTVQGLLVFCQIAKLAGPIEQKLDAAIKAQAKPAGK